jgi:hypothetical protein
MPNSKKNKLFLCFVDGEPHLYYKEEQKYIKLILDYQNILDSLKEQLKDVDKRPPMKEIWDILAKFIKPYANYCHNYNKQTGNKARPNSFENKMTRDVSSFLDLSFARLTEEEKEKRREAQKWLDEFNKVPPRVLIWKNQKAKESKNGH